MTREEIEARMAESARRREAFREELQKLIAAGDEDAKRLYAECFEGAVPAVLDMPTPGAPPHWSEKGDGE